MSASGSPSDGAVLPPPQSVGADRLPRPLRERPCGGERQGRARRLDLAGFVLAVDERLHRRGGRRAVLRRDDQRHRPLRSPGAVAQGRQGSARLEPAGVVQPAARGRSAHDRAHGVSAAPASLGDPAAGHGRAAVDPARIAAQGAHQAVRRAGALARRAGRRRRGSPQHFRQGDARAAVRGPRPYADRAAARRAGRFQGAARPTFPPPTGSRST